VISGGNIIQGEYQYSGFSGVIVYYSKNAHIFRKIFLTRSGSMYLDFPAPKYTSKKHGHRFNLAN